MKLNAKLSLLLTLTALLPASLLMGISLYIYKQQLLESNLERVQNRVTQAANEIAQDLNSSLHEVELYAQVPELTSMEAEKFLPFLISERYRHQGRYEKFIVGTPQGTYYTTAGGNPDQGWLSTHNDDDPNAKPLSIRNRDYWQNTVLKQHRYMSSTVSNPMISYTTGVKQVVVAASIVDDDSIVIGMVGASIAWQHLLQMIEQVKAEYFADLGWTPKLFLTAHNGEYWYHWDPNKIVHLRVDDKGQPILNKDGQTISVTHSLGNESQIAFQALQQHMLSKNPLSVHYLSTNTEQHRTLLYAPIEVAGYNLGIQVNDDDLIKPITKLINIYTFFLVLILSMMALFAFLFSRRLTIPLRQLTTAVRAYTDGKSWLRFPSQGYDEIATLGSAFNDMANEIAVRETELKLSQEQFNLAMRGANDGLWDWDFANHKIYYSPRWKEMLGFAEDEIGDSIESFYELLHRDDRNKVERMIVAILGGHASSFNLKYRMRCKDGSYLHILSRAFPVIKNNKVVRLVGTHVDISEQVFLLETIRNTNKELEKRVEERTQELQTLNRKLSKMSLQDALLGIGNRRAMQRDLDIISKVSLRYQKPYALALIDIDWFKRYNDHYGHMEGDKALQMVTNCILENLRNADRLYRYGGEELLMVMPNTNAADAITCAERIRKAVEKMSLMHGASPNGIVTISVGISSSNELGWTDMIKMADQGLYEAKNKGRNLSMLQTA